LRFSGLCVRFRSAVAGPERCANRCESADALVQAIPLPNVEGYFDHMAVDTKGQRLFVPGEHQRTIESLIFGRARTSTQSLASAAIRARLSTCRRLNEIWVDDGDATVKRFSGETYELVKNIPLSGHDGDKDSRRVPDNGVYDRRRDFFI